MLGCPHCRSTDDLWEVATVEVVTPVRLGGDMARGESQALWDTLAAIDRYDCHNCDTTGIHRMDLIFIS